MDKEQLLTILQGMTGKRYFYKKKEYLIKSFSGTATLARVQTNHEDIIIFYNEANQVLNNMQEVIKEAQTPETFMMLEVEKEMTQEKPINVPVAYGVSNGEYAKAELKRVTTIGSKGFDIANILMETIAKIQKGKEYIPQAQAINETIKTFIDLSKTELEMYKVATVMER